MAESAVIMRSGTPANILRQAGMMVGIAASVALGVYVVMWARTPNYSMLYSDLSDRDVTQIAEALKSTEIPHRIDPGSGAILVAASRVHDARLKLAAAGLPKSAGMGFELMQEEQGFGTSQFLERARYQRAIEGELSRSISRINNVRNARVHLGLPPQTVFSRSQREPTASVILDLYSGRKLESHQVSAITHLVSASVPNLPANKVTVVDQQGSLLTDQGGNEEVVVTGRRFEHRQRLENEYMKRIENILMPFVGADGVRAQVTADLDFTITEQTRESFNPDLPAVRSERLLEESRVGAGIGGVPGALSNEPPGTASAPEEVADATGEGVETASTAKPESIRTQTTRNYELDRTISHTKPSLGSIRRLSVAVVVRSPAPAPAADAGVEDDTAPAPAPGSPEEAAAAAAAAEKPAEGFTEEQIARMTALVKETIGFDPARGDTVSVMSTDFVTPSVPEALPEPPIWEQPWVWDVGK
ncbi:MAG: flagellar basal-body MS-ring/collar protein FliF, partial [Gammaproteobacteria bacterium]